MGAEHMPLATDYGSSTASLRWFVPAGDHRGMQLAAVAVATLHQRGERPLDPMHWAIRTRIVSTIRRLAGVPMVKVIVIDSVVDYGSKVTT